MMNMDWRTGAIVVALLVGGAPSLRAADKINYIEHVRPIFARHCLGCHNADRTKGGLDLSSYATALAGSSGGAVLVAGNPGGSDLFGSVSQTREPKMPPEKPRIPDEELATIKAWIEQGLLETATGKPQVERRSGPDLSVAGVPTSQPDPAVFATLGMPLAPSVVPARPGCVVSIAAHPFAPLVAFSGAREALIYDTQKLELMGVLDFGDGAPHALHFSRNGQVLIGAGGVGARSGLVRVWDARDGRLVAGVGDETDVVLAADIDAPQRRIAIGGTSRIAKVYSLGGSQPIQKLEKHTDWVTAVSFSPDGILLATGDRAGNLHVWETESLAPYQTLAGCTAAITALDWRADSNVLAAACEDGQVRLWELQNGKQIKAWAAHGGGALDVRFARDGRLVTAGRDNTVKLWKSDGSALRSMEAFSDLALSATFDYAGKRVIGGDFTGVVRVWNADDGAKLGDLPAVPTTIADQLAQAIQAQKQAHSELDQHRQALASAQAIAATADKQRAEAQQALQSAQQAVAAAESAVSSAAAKLELDRKQQEQAVQVAAGASVALQTAEAELSVALEAMKAATDHDLKVQADLTALQTAATSAAAQAAQSQQAANANVGDAALAQAAQQAKSAADAASARVEESRQNSTDATVHLKATIAAADSAKTKRAGTFDQHQKAQAILLEAQTTLAADQNQHGQLAHALAQAKEALTSKQPQLDERTKALSAAQEFVAKSTRESVDAEAAARIADARVAKWQAGAMRVDLDAARAALARQRADIQPILDKAVQSRQAATRLAQQVADAKQALDSAPQRIEEVTAAKTSASQALSAAQGRRTAASALLEQRSAAVAALRAALEQVKPQATAAPENSGLQSAAAKAAEALASLEKEQSAAKQALDQAAGEYSTAEQALRVAEQILTKTEAERASLPDRFGALLKQSEALEANAQVDEAAAKAAEKVLENPQTSVAELEQAYQKLVLTWRAG